MTIEVLERGAGLRRVTAGVALAVGVALAQVAPAEARGAPESFAELAETVGPAVVTITTSTVVETRGSGDGFQPMFPEGSPFNDLFRDFLGPQGGEQPEPQQRRQQGLGSGFVISDDGYIVTNNHVIDGADEITVAFTDDRELKAELVGTDPKTDIALLRVEADDLPVVPFGDSDDARVGDWVMAVGSPLGQTFSVSAGIVSARNRELSGNYDDYIQTDAAINRGNSGGPLFNMDGEVVGVNTAILSPTGGSIGIGFAMSSNVVTKVVDQLKEFGETRRGWLGVRIQPVTDDVAEALGLDDARGALVSDVPDGPAKDAGMEAGDVILSFDGTEVEDSGDLVRKVGDAEVGAKVVLGVVRDGKAQDILVELGRREEAEGSARADSGASEPAEDKILGMTLSEMTPELREQLGLAGSVDGLVVMDVDAEAEAWEKGMRAGDVIAEAAQTSVTSLADLTAAIDAAKADGRASLLMLVRREGEPRFVALPIE